MENNKINIAEILKDCPQGMELNCTIYENCEFLDIDTDATRGSYLIRITTPCGIKYLDKYGCYTTDDKAKCVIFPKGKTTWEGFVPPCKFKDGDILYIDCNNNEDTHKEYQYIFILKEISDSKIYCYCYMDEANKYKKFDISWLSDKIYPLRFATKEEKQRLFDTIKENGYRWNAETKTLEELVEPKFKVGDKIVHCERGGRKLTIDGVYKTLYGTKELDYGIPIENQDEYELVPDEIEPKFKVGDIIQDKDGYKVEITEVNTDDEYYVCISKIASGIESVSFKYQIDYELVSDEIEPKFKVGDRVKRKNVNYTHIVTISEIDGDYYGCVNEDGECSCIYIKTAQDEWELVPNKFDISTLVPFESRVLVRNFKDENWKPAIWGFYNDDTLYHYATVGGCTYIYLIPYEGNEHLLGKNKDCEDFYKTWEE